MKILVCISSVPDTTTKIKLSNGNNSVDLTDVKYIINPWDELALTRALELKEQSGGKIEKITVLTVGEKIVESTLRKALNVGADEAIRIDKLPTDAYTVATHIAHYVQKNPFDLIMAGIESSDYNGAAVGSMLAEYLDIASVSSVSNISLQDDVLIMKRTIDGGTETIKANTPVVAVVQKGIAIEPRIASMRGIRMARRIPIQLAESEDLEPLSEYVGFEMPQPKPPVKMLDSDNVGELFRLLHEEAKII
jgi:electron transfer flavoprotein beta subunit